MSTAPTPITVAGKKGTVVYLDADWQVVPAAEAVRAKVVFLDGETAWFTPKPSGTVPGTVNNLGGPGSGHYGHSGRPGEVGGSGPGPDGQMFGQRAESIPAGKQGDCFRNAAAWVREHDDHTLVHGKVTNGTGRRLDHAWAETAATVADPTTGVQMPKDDWYDLVRAAPEARYSAEQAAINMLRTGNLGPWTAEEVGKRHLDLGGAGSGNFGHAGRPGEVGGSAPGDALPPGNASPETRAAVRTASPQFKTWFKDSQVVDEDGDPLRVYHGTTHNIEAFREAGDEGLNPESDWGAGVYFTSDPDDASENYAGEGPDLTQRLEIRAEDLMGNDDALTPEAALAQARAELAGKSPSVIPAYLSMQKPVVIGEPNGSSPTEETFFETALVYADPDDPDSDIVGETGTLPTFLTTLREVAEQYDDNFRSGTKAVDAFQDRTADLLAGNEYVSASKVVAAWKEVDHLIEHPETGGHMNSEVLRETLARMGYDGVIDRTVDAKFGSSRKLGKKMTGVNPDTTHFIVFRPTQAKSAIGNKTFDPANPKLTLSARSRRVSVSRSQPQTPSRQKATDA